MNTVFFFAVQAFKYRNASTWGEALAIEREVIP